MYDTTTAWITFAAVIVAAVLGTGTSLFNRYADRRQRAQGEERRAQEADRRAQQADRRADIAERRAALAQRQVELIESYMSKPH
ncbi:Uncharacterized protein PBTT_02114 [Plasmodiophora brassicae]